MLKLLNAPIAAGLAIALAVTAVPTGAMALSKKDRQVLTGVAIGVGLTALANKGREARQERAVESYAVSTVDQAVMNAQFVFRDMPAGRRGDLQRTMRSAGYYDGKIDGAWGRGMERAFLRLYADNPRAARVSADPHAVHGFIYDLARY